LAAGGGFAAGRITDDHAPSRTLAGVSAPTDVASNSQTGTTVAPPLSGNEAEPAAAVAQLLGPAMVQITASDGLGSGFVYDKSGLVMTAAHVVGSAKRVKIQLADATQVEGEVLGADPSTDVAVIKIPARPGQALAQLGLGVKVVPGQTAIAIGSPYGLYQTVTEGIISAVDRSIPTSDALNEVPMLQTDAPINPGNSGGALADRRGRVIGINDSIYSGSTDPNGEAGNVGVGFAIPIDLAKSVADRIVAGKPIEPGFLGVSGQTSTGARLGAELVTVESGSPAAKAGLEKGDLVVAIDGRRIGSMADLAAGVRTRQPGSTVTLTVERDGKQLQTQVVLGKGK
jgi:putative serine protease PepD